METLPERGRGKRKQRAMIGQFWAFPSLGAESEGMCCQKQPESWGDVQRSKRLFLTLPKPREKFEPPGGVLGSEKDSATWEVYTSPGSLRGHS